MPTVAAQKVIDAIAILRVVPHSGRRLLVNVWPRPLYRKVVRVRRKWSYRLVYEITKREVLMYFIDPGWLERQSIDDERP